ncbi:MAG: hypothetical protein ACRDPY_24525 [Streptosporangiaceae bacterium]
MTEDQSRRPWETGYVVRGEVVAEGDQRAEQAAPVTYFQKVASSPQRDEPDTLAPTARQEEVAAVTSQDGLGVDDEEDSDEEYSATRPMPVAAVTSPDGLNADEDSDGPGVPAVPGVPGDTEVAGDDRDDVVPVTRADALASSTAAAPEVPAASEVPAVPTAPLAPVTPLAPAADPKPVIAAPLPSNYGSLLSDTADLRSQWQQIQFMFVDDPRASVTEAADVIEQVAAKLQAAIQERQRSLRGRWDGGASADTEALRETLRMYRAFLYQLIGSTGTPGS